MKFSVIDWLTNKFNIRKLNYLRHKWNYIWQPLLASTFVVVAIAALGAFSHISLLGYIGTSSLGSSAFLVFGMPHARSARLKNMWGGYIISIALGVIATLTLRLLESAIYPNHYFFAEIAATLAMAFTMLIMSLLNLEHPPAVGLSLGLVVEPWTFHTLAIIFLTVCLMSFTKRLLRNWLVELL